MWIATMPTVPGKYWVRTRDGLEGGIVTIAPHPTGPGMICCEYLNYQSHRPHSLLPGTSWKGWWWSEPLTNCPPMSESELNRLNKENPLNGTS